MGIMPSARRTAFCGMAAAGAYALHPAYLGTVYRVPEGHQEVFAVL